MKCRNCGLDIILTAHKKWAHTSAKNVIWYSCINAENDQYVGGGGRQAHPETKEMIVTRLLREIDGL